MLAARQLDDSGKRLLSLALFSLSLLLGVLLRLSIEALLLVSLAFLLALFRRALFVGTVLDPPPLGPFVALLLLASLITASTIRLSTVLSTPYFSAWPSLST